MPAALRLWTLSALTAIAGMWSSLSLATVPTPPSATFAPESLIPGADVTATDQVGSLGGEFRVNESGAATYSMPLQLPAGSAGVTPQLSLNYSSQGGNGLLGKGWSLSGISAISRCRQTLHQDGQAKPITFTSEDRFCLDGQRLILVSGTYGASGSTYKTEMDSFSKVTAVGQNNGAPDYFTVERKDGSVSHYGQAGGASSSTAEQGGRFEDGAESEDVITWAQASFKDSVGNQIIFDYIDDAYGFRIGAIYYAYASNFYHARVNFDYSERDDDSLSYYAGYRVLDAKRLSRVRIYNVAGAALELVRDYRVSYRASSGANSVSRVASIQECDGAQKCLPATVFSWSSDYEVGFPNKTFDRVISTQKDRSVTGFRFVDINGDGKQDLLWQEPDWDDGKIHDQDWKYALSHETGYGEIQLAYTTTANVYSPWAWESIDYNLDGRADLAYHDSGYNRWYIRLSEPHPDGSWRFANYSLETPIRDKNAIFQDVNSDGLIDAIVKLNDAELGIYYGEHDPTQAPSSNRFYRFASEAVVLTAPRPPAPPNMVHRALNLMAEGSAVDFNGDGKVDIAYKQSYTTCLYVMQCTVPLQEAHYVVLATVTSSGVTEFTTEGVSDAGSDHYNGLGMANDKILFGDINGDGLTDIVYPRQDEGTDRYSWYYQLSTGKGFASPVNYLPSIATVNHAAIQKLNYRMLDVDHNGESELVFIDKTNRVIEARFWDVQQNNFKSEVSYLATNIASSERDHYQFLDANGDGIVDVVQFYDDVYNDIMRVWQGHTRSAPLNTITTITNGLGASTEIGYESLSITENYNRVSVGEVGGESVQNCEQLWQSISICGQRFYPNASSFYEALNGEWELPDGSHTFGKDANRDGVIDPVLELHGPIYVVTSVNSSSPAGSPATSNSPGSQSSVDQTATSSVSYFYSEAKIQAMGRGFLGFANLMTVDEQSAVKTTTTYRQDFPFIGRPLKTEVRSNEGHLLKESTSDWRLQGWDGSSTFNQRYYQPYLYKSTEKVYELANGGAAQGGIRKAAETITAEPDEYGNVPDIWITTKEYNAYGSLIRQFQKHTDNTFPSSGWAAEKGRLISTRVTSKRDQDGNGSYELSDTRESSFTYYPSGDLRGLLWTETIEPNSSSFKLTTTHQYDSFGNKVLSKTEGGGEIRCDYDTVLYDSSGRYVDVEFDCLGRKVTEVVERNAYGSPTRVLTYLNSNGTSSVETRYSYTDRGTRYFETDETGAFGGTTLALSDAQCPTGTAYVSKTFGPSASSGNNQSVSAVVVGKECFDVLGRTTRTISRAFDGGWIYQDTEYDNVGRKQRSSEPYFAGTGSSNILWTTPVYDILGRVIKTWLPDDPTDSEPQRSVTMDYARTSNGFKATTTNALGQNKTEVVNALGEKVEIIDNDGARVTFGYDAQGNLTTTTSKGSSSDPHNIVISLTYDKLGRKTAMSDPDKGDWTYEYNYFGELTKQTNAKGQYTVIEYDALGRKVDRKDYLAGGQMEGHTQWVHDTAANGLGQLASVQDNLSGFVKLPVYDQYGRLSETVTSLGVSGAYGDHYEKVTYDQYGRTFQVFDAARATDNYANNGVEHRYNAYGYKHQIVDAVYSGGDTRKVYQHIQAMNARGQVTDEDLGNGVSRSQEFYAHTGNLDRILATNSTGKALQDLNLVWDAINNVKERYDFGYGGGASARNEKELYLYDSMNRLTRTTWYANNSQTNQQTLSYDSLGNITNKSDVGNYSYERTCGCGPHAVTQAGNTTYQYDANGNMVRDSSGRKLVYTTFDKVYRLTNADNENTVTFAYDTSRKRYLREDIDSSGTQTTLYIGSVEKITKTDGTREWKRYIGGTLMITQEVDGNGAIQSESAHYFLKDHLGTTSLVLDGSGTVEQEMRFDPWGKRLETHQTEGSKPWFSFQYALLITTRGFTGHEMVDELNVIHMNGRIYDPTLARFLQADPFIDGVDHTQGYNRYAYGKNNPLNGIDPSGFGFFKEFFDDFLGVTESPLLNAAVQIGLFFACVGNPACNVAYSSAYGGTQTHENGGSFGDALKDGLIAGVSAYAFSQVGGDWWQAGLAGGVIGGITAELQGGKFGHGFVSAGIGSAFGASELFSGNDPARVISAAIVGGTASVISGGKFANGAASSAFAAIVSAGVQAGRKPTPQEVTYARLAEGVYDPDFQGVDGYLKQGNTFVDQDTGLQSALFVNQETGHSVLAFAGTNGSGDWAANIRQAFGLKSAQHTQAIGMAQTVYANTGGNVQFVGHSLGGGLAAASAIMTGGSATIFNAAGVHPNTVGGLTPAPGSITHFRSSFDVLQPVNALTPARVYGEQVSLGAAGWHPMGGVCRAMGC